MAEVAEQDGFHCMSFALAQTGDVCGVWRQDSEHVWHRRKAVVTSPHVGVTGFRAQMHWSTRHGDHFSWLSLYLVSIVCWAVLLVCTAILIHVVVSALCCSVFCLIAWRVYGHTVPYSADVAAWCGVKSWDWVCLECLTRVTIQVGVFHWCHQVGTQKPFIWKFVWIDIGSALTGSCDPDCGAVCTCMLWQFSWTFRTKSLKLCSKISFVYVSSWLWLTGLKESSSQSSFRFPPLSSNPTSLSDLRESSPLGSNPTFLSDLREFLMRLK